MAVYTRRSHAQVVEEDGAMLIAVAKGATLKTVAEAKGISSERVRARMLKVVRLMRYLLELNPEYQSTVPADGATISSWSTKELREHPDVIESAVNNYSVYVNDPNNAQYDLDRQKAERSAQEAYAYCGLGFAVPEPSIRKLMLAPTSYMENYIGQYGYLNRSNKPHRVIFLNECGEIQEETLIGKGHGTLQRYVGERLERTNAIFINGRLFKHGNLSYLQASTWNDVFIAERNEVVI